MSVDGPAPVDEILGTAAEHSPGVPAWSDESASEEPVAELHEPPLADAPVSVAPAEERRADEAPSAPAAPLEPAVPTPARSFDPKVIAGAIAAVAALVLVVRAMVRRRRRA